MGASLSLAAFLLLESCVAAAAMTTLPLIPSENFLARNFCDAAFAITCSQNGVPPGGQVKLGREVEILPSAGKGSGVFAKSGIPAGTCLAQ